MNEKKCIFVDSDLHIQLKMEAIKRGVTLSEMVNVWLRDKLSRKLGRK